jgi:hypothetical protein
MQPMRMLVTNRAFSPLRGGTIRAKHTHGWSLTFGKINHRVVSPQKKEQECTVLHPKRSTPTAFRWIVRRCLLCRTVFGGITAHLLHGLGPKFIGSLPRWVFVLAVIIVLIYFIVEIRLLLISIYWDSDKSESSINKVQSEWKLYSRTRRYSEWNGLSRIVLRAARFAPSHSIAELTRSAKFPESYTLKNREADGFMFSVTWWNPNNLHF